MSAKSMLARLGPVSETGKRARSKDIPPRQEMMELSRQHQAWQQRTGRHQVLFEEWYLAAKCGLPLLPVHDFSEQLEELVISAYELGRMTEGRLANAQQRAALTTRRRKLAQAVARIAGSKV
jgi:hypothetical protein